MAAVMRIERATGQRHALRRLEVFQKPLDGGRRSASDVLQGQAIFVTFSGAQHGGGGCLQNVRAALVGDELTRHPTAQAGHASHHFRHHAAAAAAAAAPAGRLNDLQTGSVVIRGGAGGHGSATTGSGRGRRRICHVLGILAQLAIGRGVDLLADRQILNASGAAVARIAAGSGSDGNHGRFLGYFRFGGERKRGGGVGGGMVSGRGGGRSVEHVGRGGDGGGRGGVWTERRGRRGHVLQRGGGTTPGGAGGGGNESRRHGDCAGTGLESRIFLNNDYRVIVKRVSPRGRNLGRRGIH